MYVIAVNKSQNFLLNVRRLLKNIFSTTTQGIRLRRRVDGFFSTTSYTNSPPCKGCETYGCSNASLLRVSSDIWQRRAHKT